MILVASLSYLVVIVDPGSDEVPLFSVSFVCYSWLLEVTAAEVVGPMPEKKNWNELFRNSNN